MVRKQPGLPPTGRLEPLLGGSLSDRVTPVTPVPLPVRIAVVSHQSASVLPRLLESLERARARAGARVRAEVVVADNASGDGSVALARHSGARVIALDENVGFGAAANRALGDDEADWLVVLNPDLVLDEGFLLRLAEIVPGLPPEIGILGTALENADGSPQPSIGDFPSLGRTLASLRRPRTERKYRPLAAHVRGPADWATGAAIAVRASCFRAIGGFDPGYFLYYEDTDLCRRARDAGYGTRFEPGLRAVHLSPLAQRAFPASLVPVVRYAQLRYFRAHRPAHELWLLALSVALWSLGSALAARFTRGSSLDEPGEGVDWRAVRRALSAGVRGGPGPRLGPGATPRAGTAVEQAR